MRIALAQCNSGTDPDANLDLLERLTERAVADGAELVIFPEAMMCRFGVPLGDVAQPLDGPWAGGVARVAERTGAAVIAGMFTPSGDGRVRNTLVIAVPGEPVRGYHKIHLYDAFGFAESRTVAPGDEPVVVDVAGHRVGVATCYDIRFPALFVELARRGAELIAVPASWGAGPGKLEQWQLLASARALDCATYVAAVGQALPDDPGLRESAAPTGIGHSRISDPFGSVIADYGAQQQLSVHDLDLSVVEKARAASAVLANQRVIPTDPTE
ncbi:MULTISPECIES: carbon-nitrogen hydrolase family protein [unclassified Gordonia (in: high G+C Gram-positive bacteria)]|uniref:carbon-nitrogen hydrolase family protein n=1 Tax=unclassified Gordonia (in: high G+C Gram-positive bacteria) TaxID=2657482 RepID=UPI001FFEB7A2|nr:MULTISPECIES: carbon-nitrogen hydrolase family protein [unclassified Gordonia (in: high G+C Gram-positive bacteria)]UQE74721.1 carbon-nitrogen hydrolase family protein [Gordonia sp. PP30]